MKTFKILPVLDLLNGIVVHAIKGERKDYKPLESHLFKKPDPNLIINLLYDKYKFNEFYVADLNAIMERKPNYATFFEILKRSKTSILLDPGIRTLEDVIEFSSIGIKNLVLGLETLGDIDVILDTIQLKSLKTVFVSIDMYSEKILTRVREYQNETVLNVISD
ncbi:MAG: hypothetical protein EU532_13875, partial [Promethearchaeota archaeon]